MRPMMALGMFLFLATTSLAGDRSGDAPAEDRVRALEARVDALTSEVERLRSGGQGERSEVDRAVEDALDRSDDPVAALESAREDDAFEPGFAFGGYGELHANLGESKAPDQLDIHRLVFYVGYDFTDRISFHSEIEIEHAFVTADSDGELALEQAFVRFEIADGLALNVGRMLVPVGIVNQRHEPPSFNGVERPLVETTTIPSTWWADGIGATGDLGPSFTWELMVVGGLDGSELGRSGIRSGRIEERPSLAQPAVSGRADWFPFAAREVTGGQFLRLGMSFFCSGLDNGNAGSNPGVHGRVTLLSVDGQYTVGPLDFRAVGVFTWVPDAEDLAEGVAEQMVGAYVEAAWRFWSGSGEGLFGRSTAAVFARYDFVDTQHRMPSGVDRDGAFRQRQCTVGLTFHVTPTMVAKIDYQHTETDGDDDVLDRVNLGLGWQF